MQKNTIVYYSVRLLDCWSLMCGVVWISWSRQMSQYFDNDLVFIEVWGLNPGPSDSEADDIPMCTALLKIFKVRKECCNLWNYDFTKLEIWAAIIGQWKGGGGVIWHCVKIWKDWADVVSITLKQKMSFSNWE